MNVKQIRQRLGLTQVKFAYVLSGEMGGIPISPLTISRWESGRHRPSAAYQVKLDEIAGWPVEGEK